MCATELFYKDSSWIHKQNFIFFVKYHYHTVPFKKYSPHKHVNYDDLLTPKIFFYFEVHL